MDLVGMEVRDKLKQQLFTVLTSEESWSRIEVTLLINVCMTEAYGHPQHPHVLILWGGVPHAQIKSALSRKNFRSKMVVGIDNPELPFRPPST